MHKKKITVQKQNHMKNDNGEEKKGPYRSYRDKIADQKPVRQKKKKGGGKE